ncbi:MAG: NUDIX domain-containing protein [Patescibacteria group bacterium]
MEVKTKWVVGFLFRNNTEVALISKTHPAWQAGKLNGIGGKMDEGEMPIVCMQREFLEEAGVAVSDWKEFALLNVQDGEVHFFVAHGDYKLQSQTDEIVSWYAVADLKKLPIIQNLEWLVPLALDPGSKYTVVEYFQTHEGNERYV